jgi:mono/diheme cytochrome c family protein
MNRRHHHGLFTLVCAAVLGASLSACNKNPAGEPITIARAADQPTLSGSYNVHLEETVRFNPVQPGSDPVRGQALFGLASDDVSSDTSQALFQGPSQAFGGAVVGNGRTCFSCHRGLNSTAMGLPAPPLSGSIPPSDPVFTGINADAAGDPDAPFNLDQLGLIKYRPNRFNLARPESDPYRQIFGWRKSIRLTNLPFAHGFLNDGRGRVLRETARGAVFGHTQGTDLRFDDLFTFQDGNDMEAFLLSPKLMSDPRLAALRNPSNPMYQTLVNDPFYTVNVTTDAQARGRDVFRNQCMSCHSTPNVFNNLSNVEPVGNGERSTTDPCFAPAVARLFDIGIAERNKNGLRFTQFLGGNNFAPIVLSLANEDGTTTNLTLTFDIGLAGTTGRMADVGRFKVPQLRGVANNAPYFHDNSAATLDEVVDYFNSDAYNNSKDGRSFPVQLNAGQRADLLEFLKIL